MGDMTEEMRRLLAAHNGGLCVAASVHSFRAAHIHIGGRRDLDIPDNWVNFQTTCFRQRVASARAIDYRIDFCAK